MVSQGSWGHCRHAAPLPEIVLGGKVLPIHVVSPHNSGSHIEMTSGFTSDRKVQRLGMSVSGSQM
jgi:hypothetical protein